MKDKITPVEIIKKHFGNDYHDLPDVSPLRVMQAMNDYHQQAIQQMLEEAGSELKTQKEWSSWYDSYFEEHHEIPDSLRTFEWMQSEASKIILNHKAAYDNLWKEIHEQNATIKELKEQLTMNKPK